MQKKCQFLVNNKGLNICTSLGYAPKNNLYINEIKYLT